MLKAGNEKATKRVHYHRKEHYQIKGEIMIKNLLIAAIALSMLLSGCVSPVDAVEPSPTQPMPVEPSPTLPPLDLTPAQMSASNTLAESLGVDVGEVSFVSTEAVDWPDGCLGAARPGMMCTQAIVPGWRIVMEVDGLQYEYRTNQDASQIVSAAKIFSWIRSGGIAGMCDELAIYLPDEIVASDCKTGSKVDQLSKVANEKEGNQLREWLRTYEAQTITRDENLAADGFLFEVVFAGQGDEKMSTEVEEEILLILGDLYARMMQ